MSKSKSSTSSGINFGGLLAIVFITLKLCGVISWPWLWVLCPLWIGFAVFMVILVGGIISILIAALIAAIFGRK